MQVMISRRGTCEDAEAGEVGRMDGAVEQVLDEEMAVGVDQGQEGGRVDGPAAEVEGAQEAQRARQVDSSVHTPTVRPWTSLTATPGFVELGSVFTLRSHGIQADQGTIMHVGD
jgi:hypothetical protein